LLIYFGYVFLRDIHLQFLLLSVSVKFQY
jgi:hypothetical protein